MTVENVLDIGILRDSDAVQGPDVVDKTAPTVALGKIALYSPAVDGIAVTGMILRVDGIAQTVEIVCEIRVSCPLARERFPLQ